MTIDPVALKNALNEAQKEWFRIQQIRDAAPDLLEALMAVEMARHTDATEDWEKATALSDAAIVKATVSK